MPAPTAHSHLNGWLLLESLQDHSVGRGSKYLDAGEGTDEVLKPKQEQCRIKAGQDGSRVLHSAMTADRLAVSRGCRLKRERDSWRRRACRATPLSARTACSCARGSTNWWF